MILIKKLYIAINQLLDKNVSRHASALSFSTILALVPCLTILLGQLAESAWVWRAFERLDAFLLEQLVPKAMIGVFKEYVFKFVEAAAGIQLIGYVFFMISIWFLLSDMEGIFTELADKPLTKKPVNRVLSYVYVALAPVLILVAFGLVSQMYQTVNQWDALGVFSWFDAWLHDAMSQVFVQLIVLGLLTLWHMIIFSVLPHKKVSIKANALGSLMAGVGFLLMQFLFGLYLQMIPTFHIIYGVFALIPLFFLWIYSLWWITLHAWILVLLINKKVHDKKSFV